MLESNREGSVNGSHAFRNSQEFAENRASMAIRWERPPVRRRVMKSGLRRLQSPARGLALKMRKPRRRARPLALLNSKFFTYYPVTELFFNGVAAFRPTSLSLRRPGFVPREGIRFNYQFHLRTFA